MFKSRRGSHLVLMHDNKHVERLGRKVRPNGKPALVNETKPYAGEGGMKKLLARRKLECEEDQEVNGETTKGDHETTESIEMANMTPLTSNEVINPIPPSHIPQKNSAAFASSSSTSGSSLRVGRAKMTRNHISRPIARTSKTKFSAVFEDDGDDAMGGDDEDTLKEKEILKESARNAPVFDIPAGFNFAKEVRPRLFLLNPSFVHFFFKTKPIEHDLTGAKEPPITSLPFSFSKTVVPQELKPSASDLTSKRIDPSTALEGGNFALAPISVSISGPSNSESTEPAKRSPTSDFKPAIRNFFATSSVLSKPIEITQTTTLTLPSATTTSAFSTDPLKSAAPVKDAENPFWDGESKKDDGSRETTGLFGSFGGPIKSATASATLNGSKPVADSNNATISAFSGTPLVSQVHSAFDAVPTGTTPAFSFDKPPQVTFTFPPSSSTATNSPKPAFGELSKDTNIPIPSGEQSKFEGVEAPKLKDNLSAIETHKTVNIFEPFGAKPESTPSVSSSSAPSPFVQVAPPTNLFETGGAKSLASTKTPTLSFTTKAPADAPKPLFSAGFSFGETSAVSEKIKEQQETPFSFGALPSTPPTATDSKKTLFSFGSPAPSVSTSPAPVTFSFSGGGSTVADVSSELFSFGTPAVRPVTPPKSQDHEFRMEESPTREMQQTNGGNGNAEARPTLSFSFNSSTSAPLFGGVQPAASPVSNPSPFSFGSSTTSAAGNPFAPKETKPQFEGFGQISATPATTFNFNQVKAPDPAEAQRPATTGSFSFNATPTSATGSAPFSFAAPSNPFGQSQAGSAPSSPSTFNQPSPFAFTGPSAASASTTFSFGSQPASPAGGNVSLSLPQASTSSGFGGGSGFGAVPPPSPFSGPVPLAPSTSSGGTLFTIGAAPVIAPSGPGGPRQIRKLPNRRGGAKR
jgi:nucleoporin NUP1